PGVWAGGGVVGRGCAKVGPATASTVNNDDAATSNLCMALLPGRTLPHHQDTNSDGNGTIQNRAGPFYFASSRRPTQKSHRSDRRNRQPRAIAGVASIGSPNGLVATRSGVPPTRTTVVSPSS